MRPNRILAFTSSSTAAQSGTASNSGSQRSEGSPGTVNKSKTAPTSLGCPSFRIGADVITLTAGSFTRGEASSFMRVPSGKRTSQLCMALMMSWTALHPTCGNHRGLSGKESQDGDHYDDRVGYREVGVSGARDRCGGRRGGAGAPEPGADPGGL